MPQNPHRLRTKGLLYYTAVHRADGVVSPGHNPLALSPSPELLPFGLHFGSKWLDLAIIYLTETCFGPRDGLGLRCLSLSTLQKLPCCFQYR